MKYIDLKLTKEHVEVFCKGFNCKQNEIEHILMAYFADDRESEYYRDLSFNVDKYLLSKQVGELVIERANAVSKNVKFTKMESCSTDKTL